MIALFTFPPFSSGFGADYTFWRLIVVEDATVDDSEASEILSATSKLEALESELANMVVRIISEFHALLQVSKSSNTKDHFDTWWIEGWFREFCRFVRLLSLCFFLGAGFV